MVDLYIYLLIYEYLLIIPPRKSLLH
uniref:Uncharacterized protein n=1 Tax=Rhizophora mucronata TaxID=61149 RepID=A0A2P2NEY5_RHIMU